MTASLADDEIWHVLVAADDMKRMNLDQLADAFRLSVVDASTMVWKGGMETWRRLGSIADLEEDEPETIARPLAPPPPPRPMGRPLPKPPSPPRPPSRAPLPAPMPPPVRAQAHNIYATPLVAPVYTPQLVAPVYTAPRAAAPYAQTQRRAAIPSEVDFRRRSGGVRWGRWLVAVVLLTGGVLGAYRQNLLREGARRLGIENKYLYGEKRVTAFVSTKAPPEVTAVLTRLALLPGPNYVPPAPTTPAVAAPPPAPVAEATPLPASTEKPSEPDVKTVSLDSLPVLGSDSQAVATPAAPTQLAATTPSRAPTASRAATSVATTKSTRAAKEPVAKEPVAKAEPKKAEPKKEPTPKAAPPPANENPLKAAIRLAIAADAAKKK